jgi:6-phosphogluconolactonase
LTEPAKPKLFLARDEAALAKHAAQLVLEASAAAFRDHGRFYFCLTGGKTPRKLYETLADPYYRDRIEWTNTLLLWNDERCVPPADPESNFKMANDALLTKVPIPEKNVFRMPAEMTPPNAAAKAYEQTLKTIFKGYFPKIDLMLLGVGDDGHIASLFPKTEALNETEHWVVMNHVEKLSSNRITLTLPVINNARRILFLVSGEAKAGIVKEILRTDLPTNRYPAQLVKTYEGEITWIFDKAAMSKCPDEIRYQAFHL